ncbi:MAG: DUF2946 family protein [Burkholderiaceae bacterium]
MAGNGLRRVLPTGIEPSRLCAWVVLVALLANLASPIAAQAAASWASRGGPELIAICTAQGIRLIPLASINPEVATFNAHEPSSNGPVPGSGFGHCDACLGGVNSLASAAPIGAVDWMMAWRSPQVPLFGLEAALPISVLKPPSRGPPRSG